MGRLTLNGVARRFGAVDAVKAVDLDVADGEFVVLVGPSGCGKSTLLRVIAGLEELTAGEILLDGRNLNDVAPRDRDMAMVFQDYALYPQMTVAENLGFSLKMRGESARDIDAKVRRTADMLELDALLARKPRALSGGQRQRVALGRALIRDPAVFLFDEPLSNLDAKLRVQTRMEIRKLQMALGATSIYVTHDQVEAMTMADRIVVMRSGAVQQIGSPMAVYARPANVFVATFIGSPPMSIAPGEIGPGLTLRFGPGQSVALPAARAAGLRQGPVQVGLRAEHVTLGEGDNGFTSDVALVEDHGADSIAVVSLGGAAVLARVAPGATRAGDRSRRFVIDAERLHLFDPDGGQALV